MLKDTHESKTQLYKIDVGAGPHSYRKNCYIGTRKSKRIVPERPRRESSTTALKAAAKTGGLSYPHKWKRSNGMRY